MPHVPAFPDEIAQRILARFTSMTGADTMALNGDLATLVGLFAEELSLIDRRASEFVRAHHLDPTMPDDVLEERLNQFPLAFPKRKPATSAIGGDFTLRRGLTASSYTYPVGTIEVAPSSRPSLYFTNAEEVVFGVGDATVDNVSFVCSTPGSIGSFSQGAVNTVVSSDDGNITNANNTAELVGSDREDRAAMVNRALRWLGSLAQSQRESLESVALNFVSDNGQTVLHAKCVSNPDEPGYSVLVVDDGTAMAGSTTSAKTIGGIVPDLGSGRRYQFVFDWPAATPPKLKINATTYTQATQAWSVAEESGVMWLKENPSNYGISIAPGDVWEIGKHLVYKSGGFIAQLQAYINKYCVAAGTRVAVKPPKPQLVDISANVVFTAGTRFTRDELFASLTNGIVTFVRNLGIGEPLYLFKLIPELKKIEGVENMIFDHGDKYPGSPIHKLVTNPATINLR